MDPMDCDCWKSWISISLLWIHTGHVVMCSWTHLDPSFILPNTPKPTQIGLISPHRKHDSFETVFGIFHGSHGLWLLKVIIISLLWIHTGHVVMCSWTHLDPSFILPNTPKPTQIPDRAHHQPTQKAWQFWDSVWHLPWIPLTVIAESHHYQSFMDPYWSCDV
jgi:hypothetical protein